MYFLPSVNFLCWMLGLTMLNKICCIISLLYSTSLGAIHETFKKSGFWLSIIFIWSYVYTYSFYIVKLQLFYSQYLNIGISQSDERINYRFTWRIRISITINTHHKCFWTNWWGRGRVPKKSWLMQPLTKSHSALPVFHYLGIQSTQHFDCVHMLELIFSSRLWSDSWVLSTFCCTLPTDHLILFQGTRSMEEYFFLYSLETPKVFRSFHLTITVILHSCDVRNTSSLLSRFLTWTLGRK